jgi:hypothetical protein
MGSLHQCGGFANVILRMRTGSNANKAKAVRGPRGDLLKRLYFRGPELNECPSSSEKMKKDNGLYLIGDRDQADDHRAHLAQDRSQNQAFEGGCFNHLSRLLGSPDPRLFGALLAEGFIAERASSEILGPNRAHP